MNTCDYKDSRLLQVPIVDDGWMLGAEPDIYTTASQVWGTLQEKEKFGEQEGRLQSAIFRA